MLKKMVTDVKVMQKKIEKISGFGRINIWLDIM